MPTPIRSIDYWSGKVNAFSASVFESGAGHPAEIACLAHELESRTVLEHLKLTGEETLVDIGAGAGRWSVTLAPRVSRVIALEPSELYTLLQQNTQPYENIKCLRRSCEQYSAPVLTDIVLVSGVLMYLDKANTEQLLSQAERLLKPGGTLVLREPVSARGLLRVGSDYFPIGRAMDLSLASYWEFLRKKSFYLDAARKLGMECTYTGVTHAPLLYYLPKWVPFRANISRKSLQTAARKTAWPMVWKYNRLARKPYEWLENLLSKRSFRLFFFVKGKDKP